MKSWLVVFFAVISVTCGAHRAYIFNDALPRKSAFEALETIEKNLCVLYVEDSTSHRGFYGALKYLRSVKSHISAVERKYMQQPDVLAAIESLVVLKSEQIRRGSRSLDSITGHLQQLKNGLSLAVETDFKADQGSDRRILAKHNGTLAAQILARYYEQGVANASPSKPGNMHPTLIKTLKTGALIMVMLSTTADVCVVTGPAICFALYVAGSGAVIIWFTQIYRATLGVNNVIIRN